MAVNPNVVIASCYLVLGGEIVWQPTLRRATFDWEIPRVAHLLERLQNISIRLDQEDHWVWAHRTGGIFIVKFCYEFLANAGEAEGPWNTMWYTTTPLKVQFFIWTAALGKISTMNMLWRKGFYMPSICLLCYQHSESCSLICCFIVHFLGKFGVVWLRTLV